MNKNRVSVAQLAVLLLLVITGGKFLALPSVLARDVGHDSWLVLCFGFLWDAVCLCFLLWAVKINRNKLGLEQILNSTLTKVGSKVILVLFFVIFACRIILLADSCYNAFAVTFDVNTNWLLFVLPILAVAGFAVFRGFNAIARVGQILVGLIFLSLVALLVNPAVQAKYGQLLPVGEAGWGNIVATSFLRSFWFSDYIFVYFVLEDIKPSQRLFAPMLTSFSVGAALTVFFNVVFVALFGQFAQYNDLAMSKIGLFSVSQTTAGRWDWLTLTIWLTSVILKVVIFTFCAYKCVEKIFQTKSDKLNFIVLAVLAAILLVPMFVPVNALLKKFLFWCVIPFGLVQYVLPLAMPLLTRCAHKKMPQKEEACEQS